MPDAGLNRPSDRLRALAPERRTKLELLRVELRRLAPIVVAFSGGADSALLAWVANDSVPPGQARAITAISPSLAPWEQDECRRLALEWGLLWDGVETNELANAAYTTNDGQRCFHCKMALMDVAERVAAAAGVATVVLGVNVDDLGDHRPGQAAAAERGARFPFVDAGLGKEDVRAISKALGLVTWDKPAAACLASRLPYGTPVTVGTLEAVAAAEAGLRAMGYRQVRVRHYGDLARIELEVNDLVDAINRRTDIVAAVQAAGYRYVTVDLEGFRTGNLNQALATLTSSSGTLHERRPHER